MSRQRTLIKALLRSGYAHGTAEEIFRAAREEMSEIGLATVYRNLNYLADHGEIRRITVSDGKDRFDPTLVPHEHAICRMCGKMRDVETGDLRAYLRSHLKTDDFCYELCIHDVCPECRARIQDNKALKEE